MEYNFSAIEQKWQQQWKDSDAYKVSNNSPKPKFYVLDMFPYPSGAGLHVGHPLGYIASDIYARYKRLKGYNVLHPMGYDSFGLPAEQYAIETGQHPATTTEKNIATFRSQLDKIGFCFDWSREVRTSDPSYYKWTQWLFLQLYNSYFCNTQQKARPIADLIQKYATQGAMPKTGAPIPGTHFTAEEWNGYTHEQQEAVLAKRRLAFCAYGEVNWCEALGTVLANDEVVNGVSERGGHPVEKKKMRQWYLRITAYADRLLEGLEKVEFSEAMKEMQRNWIGKSQGAEVDFEVSLTPNPSPTGEGERSGEHAASPMLPGNNTADKKWWDILKQFGRDNRKAPTEAEDLMWQHLRNNQLGYKVRRQHAIGTFIADFVFIEKKLVVEIDGSYHNEPEQKEYDEARTSYLANVGFSVIRFTNEEVLLQTKNVVNKIKAALEEKESSSDWQGASPLSQGRGAGGEALKLRVYTTRPDTIFGVDFMVLAPEHELVAQITAPEQKEAIDNYLTYVKSRSERERQAEVKVVTGCFTGAYALNPFDGRQIPIWIAEYVLAGYGTGAIMAVPCGDQRDYTFAQHFNIPITNIIGAHYNGQEANPTKDAVLENSGFLNGLLMKDAIGVAIDKLEEQGIGKRKVNYRMRDAGFSRQRYWGEPFPIIWKDGTAYPLDEKELPLELPHVDSYGPGPEGEGPLANIPSFVETPRGLRETSTMPGYAGSSWYFLRYMDPHNDQTFCDRSASDYWGQVDLYIGGTEHAVGHLLYSRMWTKVLYDLGLIGFDEPFKRLLNQGMITGVSEIAQQLFIRITGETPNDTPQRIAYFDDDNELKLLEIKGQTKFLYSQKLYSKITNELMHRKARDNKEIDFSFTDGQHIPIGCVENHVLDIDKYLSKYPYAKECVYVFENGYYVDDKFHEFENLTGAENNFYTFSIVEKMSKSKLNVENPDDIIAKYGADTFRMYEMFLGPVEMSKPWDTKGIEGVHRFLRKLWRLFFDELKGKVWNDDKATPAELKTLHKTIKKIEGDTENFSFNTAVSAFMVCVNELTDLKCHKKEVLSQLLILLTPYAPHISEELWAALGNGGSVLDASFPQYDEQYLVEAEKEYPISINGKMRTTINIATDAEQPAVEQIVLANEVVQKWLDGNPPKKIIFVKNKMVNVVV